MERHSLLKRQLKKYSPFGEDKIPFECEQFIEAVNEAYHSFDGDRKMLERSMELSSEELIQMNESLVSNEQTLIKALRDLQKTHEELKYAYAQLFQSEKLASIGRLASGVAHEINNPLSFVCGNMECMKNYTTDLLKVLCVIKKIVDLINNNKMEKANDLLREVCRIYDEVNLDYIINDVYKLLDESKIGLERIRKIIADLRTFARKDTDDVKDVSIEEILEGTLNIIDSEVKYIAEVKKDYDPGLPRIKCNEQRLSQVFMNLIMNAVQAIDGHGLILIRTFYDDNFVYIEVSDTGSGIPENALSKIFDPFFTTKPAGKGTGLGLSISYEIVQKYGGDMKVVSKLGEGTTFTVMFPRLAALSPE
ncbi:MAG: ATP-binding protein [Candidatus Omnitrophica bacterium]|nr:ATP-binding protein [Candidatus Omnitrophota bacterium]MDD5488859.1 ATP-binding protein [Candidatus Omnitrophota bacterium]